MIRMYLTMRILPQLPSANPACLSRLAKLCSLLAAFLALQHFPPG